MKSAKEILEELKASQELTQLGWTRPPCKLCYGTGQTEINDPACGSYLVPCACCEGSGFQGWVGPITK